MLHSFTHARYSRLKFLFVNQPISIAIDQTSNPSTELAHLGFQTCMLVGLLLGVQPLSIFSLQPLWILKQSADFLPDRRIGLVHTHLLVPTHALETLSWDIHGSPTTIICIALIVGSTTISIPTFRADEQALQ